MTSSVEWPQPARASHQRGNALAIGVGLEHLHCDRMPGGAFHRFSHPVHIAGRYPSRNQEDLAVSGESSDGFREFSIGRRPAPQTVQLRRKLRQPVSDVPDRDRSDDPGSRRLCVSAHPALPRAGPALPAAMAIGSKNALFSARSRMAALSVELAASTSVWSFLVWSGMRMNGI